MKVMWSLYFGLLLAMIATSLVTGRRATVLTGEPHYLLTRTSILVERHVAPKNATDAALDAVFEEAGESTDMTVEEPMFVLGLADATGPVVLGGGLVVLVLGWRQRRRRRRPGGGAGGGAGPEL
ncbi:MAG TPA: hypothetical protein VJZ71_14555 [Phycisphaerae bacterium]|nr:hypothetical protein [Phycisphaerae bacterium]